MRAIFLESLESNTDKSLHIEGDAHKHLSKVVRIKKGEQIKILNGRGMVAIAEVIVIDKKETQLSLLESHQASDQRKFHVIVGLAKKEALEEIMRKSVELGVRSVQFIVTEYSQKNSLKPERVSNILESAYCQSNNPWKLEIHEPIKFSELKEIIERHSSACFMSLRKTNTTLDIKEDALLIVGPEGGFSSTEEDKLQDWGVNTLSLDMPIMRAPTAVVAGIGFLHSVVSV